MALLQFEAVNIQYEEQVLFDINFEVAEGDFVTIFGASGSGKSTLLKQLKPMSTSGICQGSIYFEQQLLEDMDERQKVTAIGSIFQNPDEQLIAEDVWHELAFGLENIGLTTAEMKIRIGEMANFFGIQKWFRQKVQNLSGGQKQLLNIASVLVLHPKLLVLDEPTAQLDPIAAKELLDLLGRINRDLGVTIILVEHRLDDVLPHTSHFMFMEEGRIRLAEPKASFFQKFVEIAPDWQRLLPAVIQVSLALHEEQEPAWTVHDAVKRISGQPFSSKGARKTDIDRAPLLTVEKVNFRYERFGEAILKDVSFTVEKGEVLTFIGGNGAGKSTLLQLIAGQKKAFSGKFYFEGERQLVKKSSMIKQLAFLPQDPSLLFLENTVQKDYELICQRYGFNKEEQLAKITASVDCMQIHALMHKHPDDLSGGEKQKVALGKLLLASPQILLLDEPTKGLDAVAKNHFAKLVKQLQQQGLTLIIVTHDLELAAEVSDRCGLLFDGEVVALMKPHAFFKTHHFYTTAAKLISKKYCEDIILTSELIDSLQQGEMVYG